MNSKEIFIYVYSLILTLVASGFIFYAAFFHDYSAQPGSGEVINVSLGFLLGTALSTIIGYFFGSSTGSKEKSEQIAKQSEDLIDVSGKK